MAGSNQEKQEDVYVSNDIRAHQTAPALISTGFQTLSNLFQETPREPYSRPLKLESLIEIPAAIQSRSETRIRPEYETEIKKPIHETTHKLPPICQESITAQTRNGTAIASLLQSGNTATIARLREVTPYKYLNPFAFTRMRTTSISWRRFMSTANETAQLPGCIRNVEHEIVEPSSSLESVKFSTAQGSNLPPVHVSKDATQAPRGAEAFRDPSRLTHVNAAGQAHMVDVGAKAQTKRVAIACSAVRFTNPESFSLIDENRNKKGDALGTSRIAGIMAAKRTSDLLPLCHPLAINKVDVRVELLRSSETTGFVGSNDHGSVMISAQVECVGPTGVEMEALTAASVAALNVYDMCKAVDRGMEIVRTQVVYKSGGKSGLHFHERWARQVGAKFFSERELMVPPLLIASPQKQQKAQKA